jgi:hypothetical protein
MSSLDEFEALVLGEVVVLDVERRERKLSGEAARRRFRSR